MRKYVPKSDKGFQNHVISHIIKTISDVVIYNFYPSCQFSFHNSLIISWSKYQIKSKTIIT